MERRASVLEVHGMPVLRGQALEAAGKTAPVQILLVEDEASLQALYDAQLTDEGYEVEVLETGEQALERLRRPPLPDALILDIKLTGVDGLSVMRQILSVMPDLPIILHSAYPDYRGDFSSWCADAYVVKSTDRLALSRTLAEVLARRRDRRLQKAG
jgi:CheY-like chemotaxis protein